MLRIFAGLAIPEPQQAHLKMLGGGLKGARWIEPKNYHITLRFIGEVAPQDMDDIHLALQSVAAAPFEVLINDLGTFGRPPKSLWAGVRSSPDEKIDELFRKIENALVKTGLEPERRNFTPHVTLARLRSVSASKVAAYMETRTNIGLEPFIANSFSLFQSHLSAKGADYQQLQIYNLS